MNVIEAIRTKRAVRAYRDDPVPDDVARTILHAGRRAQSAKNDQPWHFLVIRERATLRALAATSPNLAYIAGAPLCVALVTPLPSEKQTILFDAGQAAACMQLAAWELGVVSCLGTVYELEKARTLLGFPPRPAPAPRGRLRLPRGRGLPAARGPQGRPPPTRRRRALGALVRLRPPAATARVS